MENFKNVLKRALFSQTINIFWKWESMCGGLVCLCAYYYQSKQKSKDVKYQVTLMIVNTFVKPQP